MHGHEEWDVAEVIQKGDLAEKYTIVYYVLFMTCGNLIEIFIRKLAASVFNLQSQNNHMYVNLISNIVKISSYMTIMG